MFRRASSLAWSLAAAFAGAGLLDVFTTGVVQASEAEENVIVQLQKDKNVGVGFDLLTYATETLKVKLNAPAENPIAGEAKVSKQDGTVIWKLDPNPTATEQNFTGTGLVINSGLSARFNAKLQEAGQGGGDAPEADASIADLDIDADTVGVRSDEGGANQWPPDNSLLEDQLEEQPAGGFALPKALHPVNCPDTLPDGANYKLLRLRLRTRYVGHKGEDWNNLLGSIYWTLPAEDKGVAFYDLDSKRRITVTTEFMIRSATPDATHDVEIAVLSDNRYNGGVSVTAKFTWQSTRSGGSKISSEDSIRLTELVTSPAVPRIVPDTGQRGVNGDLVISTQGAGGQKHYVSPRAAEEFLVFKPQFPPGTGNFAEFEWHPTPEAGTDVQDAGNNKVKVKRDAAKKIPLQILRKSDSDAVDTMNAWIVWSEMAYFPELTSVFRPVRWSAAQGAWVAADAANREGFEIGMGYWFEHTILPQTILTNNPAADVPRLTGGNATPPPPPEGLHIDGSSLALGADRKWDSSRIFRTKVLNPNAVPVPADYWGFKTYPDFPSLTDGDARPGGAGAVTAEVLDATGNDDSNQLDEQNDPYNQELLNRQLGLICTDRPSMIVEDEWGENEDTLELRRHFQEFARLELGTRWYRISDRYPWRVHLRFKRIGGLWTDDGSSKDAGEHGNDGF